MTIKPVYSASGSALLAAIGAVIVIVGILIVAFDMTDNVARNAARARARDAAMAVADGALELEYAQWQSICEQSSTTWPNTSAFSNIALPTQADFPYITGSNFPGLAGFTSGTAATGYVLSNFNIQAVDARTQQPTASGSSAPALAASGATSTYYLGTANVTLPSRGGDVTVKLGRIFQRTMVSPWQFAIFYSGTMEIFPGANMTVTGPVHTNSIMYAGGSGGVLTFQSSVTASANSATFTSPVWYNTYDPLDTDHSGTPTPPVFNDGAPVWSAPSAGPNNAGQAGLSIFISGNTGNTVTAVINNSGVTTTVGAGSTGSALTSYNAIVNTLTLDQSFTDNREGATMQVTSVNVNKLNSAISSGAIPSISAAAFNGVVSISNTSTKPNTAIQLTNGATLTSNLTIASTNPVYVQGDYNTTANSSGNPYSAAIVGDAVTILSNAWNPANSSAALSSRVATPTTVNAGIMTGNVPTGAGVTYSGGVENLLRFLEDWSGVKFTYNGSLVCLNESQIANQPWGASNVYDAPTRVWSFNPQFLTNPPPGDFERFVYSRQRWFVIP